MKLKVYLPVIISGMIFLFAACKKDNNSSPPALGYSYFPLETGKSNYYQVDSIGWLGYTYDPNTNTVVIDTVHYEIKETVESFFTDNEGRETARIVRYRRNDSSQPWTLYKVITANITATKAERYEDNVRYTKLIFPPAEGEKWTGQYVDVPLNDTAYSEWEYEYETVNEPGTAGGLAFDSVATIIQKNDINLIEYRHYTEQYAAGTGMIFKEYQDYEYLNTVSTFIKNGFIYRETLFNP
jgi:hypothetical protein